MRVSVSLTPRLAAGLAGPVLALALVAPAYSADLLYQGGAEYEHYSEPAPPPPVYAPPVYGPPAYVSRPYVYRRYGHVYPPPAVVRPYPYGRYVEIEPRPPAPIYGPPGAWSAYPPPPPDEEVVEGPPPPHGYPAEPFRRW